MSRLRRLDHVAYAVRDTDGALRFWRDRLGLRVVSSEEIPVPRVRLTYLDAGNAFVQLVEPLDPETPIARFLAEEGEGLHHLCFGVEGDPVEAAAGLAPEGAPAPVRGSGRGRVASFVPGELPHGARIECTEFSYEEDVERTRGWLE